MCTDEVLPLNILTDYHHAKLMIKIQRVAFLASSELLNKVLSAIICLEGTDKGRVTGLLSAIRKAKSLVRRWLHKVQNKDNKNKSNEVIGEKFIERDTVVLVKIVTIRGVTSVKLIKKYRVIGIHHK